MKRSNALLLLVILITMLVVGCSPSQSTNFKTKRFINRLSETPQSILKKALVNWESNPEHQLITWSIKQNQIYPLKNSSYQAVKTTEATEEHYEKGQIHATATHMGGFALNQVPSKLELEKSSDQWQVSEKLSYHKYINPNNKTGNTNKWMLSKNEHTDLLLPSLQKEFLDAIKDSESSNNLLFTQTSDSYEITAKPEFYAMLPQFLNDIQQSMRFPFYPKAVMETVKDGKASMMDYNAQKVTIKSADISIIVDKKTMTFKKVVFHYQLELSLSGGTPAKADYVQTMNRTGNFQKAFIVPAEALEAKDNDNN